MLSHIRCSGQILQLLHVGKKNSQCLWYLCCPHNIGIRARTGPYSSDSWLSSHVSTFLRASSKIHLLVQEQSELSYVLEIQNSALHPRNDAASNAEPPAFTWDLAEVKIPVCSSLELGAVQTHRDNPNPFPK